jgi:hypothetical protein
VNATIHGFSVDLKLLVQANVGHHQRSWKMIICSTNTEGAISNHPAGPPMTETRFEDG